MSNFSCLSCMARTARPEGSLRVAMIRSIPAPPSAPVRALTYRSPYQSVRQHFSASIPSTLYASKTVIVGRNAATQNTHRSLRLIPGCYRDNSSEDEFPTLEDPSKNESLYDIEEMLENIKKQKHAVEQTEVEKPVRMRREKVMNIDELVKFLHGEKAQDVCVIRPTDARYYDYFVVCTGTVTRHIAAMANNLAAEVWAWPVCGRGSLSPRCTQYTGVYWGILGTTMITHY